MLALEYPDITSRIEAFPGGLMPIRLDGKLALAVKISKEALLAVREKGGFSVYAVPVPARDGTAISLVSAFFDDDDEPLVVRTPLFGDETPSIEIVALLTGGELDVYFFDEMGWERMSYRCRLADPGSCLGNGSNIRLAPYTPDNSAIILEYLGHWFGARGKEEDALAIQVQLEQELWPNDQAILDLRDGPNSYVGSDGYLLGSLERDASRPGYYQERDIAALVRRFLAPEQVILNPFRRGTDKEFADLICGTDTSVLIFQAKDSPTTAVSMARSITRKQSTARSQLREALTQATGALRYAHAADPVALTCKKKDIELHIAGRELVAVVIIKEIFPAQSDEIVEALKTWLDRGRRLVILDFPGFSTFAHHHPVETEFVSELARYSDTILARGKWLPAKAYINERLHSL